MREKYVQLESHWGVTFENKLIEQNSDILTIILPGQNYSNEKPLMYYSSKVALELGLDVFCIDYGFQISHKDFDPDTELEIVIRESINILKKSLFKKYKKIIFVGKSLGTIVQNSLSEKFRDYEQVHIYITPVDKTFENMVKCPCLIITGTEDRKINSLNMKTIEKRDNAELIKIIDGNHRLENLDALNSIKMLNAIMTALKEFMLKHLKD